MPVQRMGAEEEEREEGELDEDDRDEDELDEELEEEGDEREEELEDDVTHWIQGRVDVVLPTSPCEAQNASPPLRQPLLWHWAVLLLEDREEELDDEREEEERDELEEDIEEEERELEEVELELGGAGWRELEAQEAPLH